MVTRCPSPTGYFKIDNLFSEIWTESQRTIARKNLGIGDDISLKWGNIKGDLSKQQDLINLLKESGGQLNYSPDKLLDYNDDFVKCKNELFEGEITNLQQAVDLILYKLFPVELTEWDILADSVKLTYTIEKGTKQALDPNTSVGIITVKLIPGNKGDVVEYLTINGDEYDFSVNIQIPVFVKDITDRSETDTTIKKYYTIILKTTSGYTVRKQITASIEIKTTQYYYYNISDDSIFTITTFSPNSGYTKLNSNEYMFNCGESEKYVAVLSPKRINKVETTASSNVEVFPDYSIITGYNIKEVSYNINGILQTYYLVELIDPQCNYVKIKVS